MTTLLGTLSLTVTRYGAAGSFVRGVFSPDAPSTFSIIASVQPLTGRELQQLPELQRTSARMKLYTTTQLETAREGSRADRVAYRGRELEVQVFEDWQGHQSGLPHYKYILAEPGEDQL